MKKEYEKEINELKFELKQQELKYKEKEILTEDINTEEADILYDLIKDGLVEKVKE